MKKVFMVHGFRGTPNGGWRPWLMAKLDKKEIYACALSMPSPDAPVLEDWLKEISRHLNISDEIYLVGHSLGSTTILRLIEQKDFSIPIEGILVASGPCRKNNNRNIDSFLEKDFDFETIKRRVKKVVVIHGDNDPYVPLADAEIIAKELNGKLIVIKNGKHLNAAHGFTELPEALTALEEMF